MSLRLLMALLLILAQTVVYAAGKNVVLITTLQGRLERIAGDSNESGPSQPKMMQTSFNLTHGDQLRVEQILSGLQRERGSEPQVKLLVSLHQHAMRNALEARGI